MGRLVINSRSLQGKPMNKKNQKKAQSNVGVAELAFCPHKDLNMPVSYEEVIERFQKIQGSRAKVRLN